MRLHDLAFSLANMRVARQVLFQIKLALFDHQQQEVSEIPSNSSECAAEAAARIFRLAFRVAMVNSISDRVYFWPLFFAEKYQASPGVTTICQANHQSSLTQQCVFIGLLKVS